MTAPSVLIERDGSGITRVVLNRPERRNAFTETVWRDLHAAVTEVAGHDDDRVVILTGTGADFSTGGDLADPDVLTNGVEAGMRRASEVVLALHSMAKPTIAAVRGRAIGGGLGLALACDLVIASDTAVFWPAFGRRGMVLDCGTSWSLPRLIGLQQAKRLTYLADPIPAPQALALGLAAQLVPDAQLDAAAAALAKQLLDMPREALLLNTELLDHSLSRTLPEALDAEVAAQVAALDAPSFKAAIRAFLAGRRDG